MVNIERPKITSPKLTIGTFPLKDIAIQKHRPLTKDMFDIKTLLPLQKFFDYMKPLLVDLPKTNRTYFKLTHNITKRSH